MVLVATQVKRRRGTTAENDAFTGAEGEITVDTEKHELRVHDGVTQGGFVIGSGGSGSGRNIGDMFMTKRTDTALAGAVECNGGTYNTEDYEGAGSIGELLEAGKLDYISLTAYATAISTKGWCDKIGWDGTGTTSFRVPTLTPRNYIVKVQEPTAENNYTWYRLYADGWVEQGGYGKNTAITLPIEMALATQYTAIVQYNPVDGDISNGAITVINKSSTGFTVYRYSTGTDEFSWQVSGMSNITPESASRVMIQLFNGATDEAVATCTSVLADMADLKDMSNVTATGKETVAGWGMPDWSAGIAISTFNSSHPYTMPSDGFIFAAVSSAKTLRVNGSEACYMGISSGTQAWGLNAYASKNDIITTDATSTARPMFYPLKGVNQ